MAALAATGAFAQSSVTISGQLDAGISNVEQKNGVFATKVGTGIHGASRLRFVGTEDMGGGNKANFALEMQPSFENGSVNADLFNRGAWLGLEGGWGEVRLGRQGTNTIGAICTIDQHGCYSGYFGGGILFSGQDGTGNTGAGWMLANPTRGAAVPTVSSAGVLTAPTVAPAAGGAQVSQATSTLGTSGADATRYVKAIRYSLPAFVTGLSVNAAYAFGTQSNGITTAQGGSTTGIDATYANGPLAVVFAHQQANAEVNNANAAQTGKGELTTIGGTYNLGVVKLGAGFQQEKASAATATLTAGLSFTKGESYALTATVPMGAFTPYVKYGEHKYSGGTLGSINNAKITNVGVRYALSNRSLVYVDYVQNGAALMLPISQKNMGSIGIQHNF